MAKKKAAKKSALKSAKQAPRKPGKPKRSERVVGPTELQTINRLWLRKTPLEKIAAVIGVHHSTISHHIKMHLRPRWEKELRADLAEDMAKCAEIEAAAWASFESTKNVRDLDAVRWCLEHRAKIAGHFASSTIRHEGETEVRVAGMSPAEFGAQTLLMIKTRAKEARDYEERVRRLGLEGD